MTAQERIGQATNRLHDRRALLAPSAGRGKPTGAAMRAVARELPSEQWAHAEATLAGTSAR